MGETYHSAVLIVGAGISGMCSALILAEMGYKVYLLDSAPGVGGSLHLLDRTFPTDSCGLCLMAPVQPAYCPSLECALNPNIEILSYCELESLKGKPGAFQARIYHKPRYVDVERCSRCGLCVEVCPAWRPAEYEGPQKAIYRPPTRAVPDAFVIDKNCCTECGKCVEICPAGAIDLKMSGRHSELEIGAVILSPGFAQFDARLKAEYGWGRYPNVLTSFQFERMVSLSGPTMARILRPSDNLPPRRVAFIHCVGSRDATVGRDYCSAVCCTYTAKQVAIAKELLPELEISVFYIDLRPCGEDAERYLDRVLALPGVRYRQGMVSMLKENPRSHSLLLTCQAEDSFIQEEEFDMAVLAVGFGPPEGFRELGEALGVDLNEYGFCPAQSFAPNETSRPGIFVSGAFREPKDISETVSEAAGAAACAARLLGPPHLALETEDARAASAERDVSEEEPRVGVFLCACPQESALDLEGMAARAVALPKVAVAQVVPGSCAPSGLAQIAKAIYEEKLNRVVIAVCNGLFYRPLFENVMREAGLNPYLLETVNIYEECAWVHQEGSPAAAEKAFEMVSMAVRAAAFHRPLHPARLTPQKSVLVIGGGLAGMTAALELAALGHPVALVEKEGELGGMLRRVRRTAEGEETAPFLKDLISRVEENPLITVYRRAQVKRVEGHKGRFRSAIALADGHEEIVEHGAIIVAAGGREAETDEYLYGKDERVITQLELEAMLETKGEGLTPSLDARYAIRDARQARVVMIQCVGSREEARPYCSRVCCPQAVKNALRIKELWPETQVFILYRDVRTPGFGELLYRRAREAGVIFIRYEPEDKPAVMADSGCLRVRVHDSILGEEISLPAELVVLSVGVAPNDNHNLARILGVPLDRDGFFRPENGKVRPLETSRAGIFLCGMAGSPRPVNESIAQARGAAICAAALLAKPYFEEKRTAATVNERLCSGCGLCVSVCPYGARVMDEERHIAQVVEILCQGCGACAALCPNKATQQKSFRSEQVLAIVDEALG
ncbi:MAG: FAD-dependent oxidoreductase [Anaerolineae bacterium]